MRDIGALDKRISNLEYYTSLSLLEKEVTGSDITDETNEAILFKNGFLEIKLDVIDNPTEVQKPVTGKDKFQAMARKNPNIHTLKNRFNLDIEY
jgi:hypothetical protein